MNISNILIHNFRNYEEFSISFSKGFQTIIGENNVGKTNLLFALRLVLDKNLRYHQRKLSEQDFFNFRPINVDSYISITVDFNLDDGDRLAIPIATSDNSARISYVYAHKSVWDEDFEFEDVDIRDYSWRLYAAGSSLTIQDLIQLHELRLSDLEMFNVFQIDAFRDIYKELHGNSQSLLSQYCLTRDEIDSELAQIKEILDDSTDSLNEKEFVQDIAANIQAKSDEVSGRHFNTSLSIGFASSFHNDVWNKLQLYFNLGDTEGIPIKLLGLGQKNLIYLTLFLTTLRNHQNEGEFNLLMIEEPEAHLHPQLQKLLFARLGALNNTQVIMTSHSTEIASDCEFKNLNVIFRKHDGQINSFSPFSSTLLTDRESKLLKRFLDATRSELFFSSAIIFVEGVAEQFIIPKIAKEIFDFDLKEYNVSVIPIHSRGFSPYLKLVQNEGLSIPVCVIMDGDSNEVEEGEETAFVSNAKALEVEGRVKVFSNEITLETELFPDSTTNNSYLSTVFNELGHTQSHQNLTNTVGIQDFDWSQELLKRIDKTVLKGRFAQELSLHIDSNFIVPEYINEAIVYIKTKLLPDA